MRIEPTDLRQIRKVGIEVLNRELGPVATIRFLQQYETGKGDYSTERHEWIDKVTIEDIAEEAKRIRERKQLSSCDQENI